MVWKVLVVISTLWILDSCSGSALHGPCESDANCGTFDTYCKNGTCACLENFLVDRDTCMQLATPHKHCKRHSDCASTWGVRSACKKSRCVCKSFHHLHNGQCIKNRELSDMCDADHQCYCGQHCSKHMACIDKTCRCKPGFTAFTLGRTCISHHPTTLDAGRQAELQEHNDVRTTTKAYPEKVSLYEGETVKKSSASPLEASATDVASGSGSVIVTLGNTMVVSIVLVLTVNFVSTTV